MNQRIAAGLLGGVLLLLCELRFEHRRALGETWRSWIPLVWAGATLVLGPLALWRWNAGGRRLSSSLFGVGVLVGLLGFWFHTGGHPLAGLGRVLAAWLVAPGHDGGLKVGSGPPALAPLALCGLGALGWLASRSRAAK